MKLTELFDEYGIPYYDGHGHKHARSGWVQLDCPFCLDGENKFHMGYNPRSHVFVCYKCGQHAAYQTVKLLFPSKKPIDAFFQNIRKTITVEEQLPNKTPHGICIEPDGVGPMAKMHRDYLRNDRKFDPDTIAELWGVQGITFSDRFSHRLFIPIYLRGDMVSWTTRSILPNASLRYISARPEEEKYHHKHLLYGEDYCTDTIIICEGPTDVWNIGPGAVATFGLNYTKWQVARMVKYPNRIICFDNSDDAQNTARQLALEMKHFPGRTLTVCLRAKDPGSAPKKEIRKLRQLYLGA